MKISIRKVFARISFVAIVSLTGMGSLALAHHGGGLDSSRELVVGPMTGVVTEFAFRFPHIQLYIDVTENDGTVQKWALTHGRTPTMLRERGWTRDTVRPGDVVTVMYRPHVQNGRIGSMTQLEVNGESIEF